VRIERFDPAADLPHVRACFEMTQAGWPADHPNVPQWSLGSFTGKWLHGFDASPQQCWLALAEGGAPLGGYLLRLGVRENASLADCVLIVRPDRRRAGVGRALAAHCAGQARLAGRSRLAAETRDGSPGAAFAAALGASPGPSSVNRLLDIGNALVGRLAGLRAAALPHAVGYSLESWAGPAPDEYLDDVVRLDNVIADAPREAGLEPMLWDAGRVRESEKAFMASGLRSLTVIARQDSSSEAAALTRLCIDAGTPEWAFQLLTAVLPGHRGHRLGLLVKIANLELLAETEPQVRRIWTGNAGSNDHMISINAQLGFEPSDTYRTWTLGLTAEAD
jgi:GNAT superfamily N-acetyltransferase